MLSFIRGIKKNIIRLLKMLRNTVIRLKKLKRSRKPYG
jgi:hypothetical protein